MKCFSCQADTAPAVSETYPCLAVPLPGSAKRSYRGRYLQSKRHSIVQVLTGFVVRSMENNL